MAPKDAPGEAGGDAKRRRVKIEGDDSAFNAISAISETAKAGAKKEEVKQELKEEVKEEVKEELDKLLISDAANDKKDKKDKKRKAEDGEGKAEDGFEGPVDTDTEYEEVPLSDCPQRIEIKMAGNKTIEGVYDIMKQASRGKPAYKMQNHKRTVYLFWNKKWVISYEFGSKQKVASAKDAGQMSPCEPYPHAWTVIERKKDKPKEEQEKVWVTPPGMRVIDMGNADLLKDHEMSDIMNNGVVAALHHHRRHHHKGGIRKKERKVLVEVEADAGKGQEASRPASKPAAAADDDELGPGSSAEEEKSSQSDSDSDSDSGASSSSEASASASVANNSPVTKAKAMSVQDQAALEKQKAFCEKIRSQLFNIKNVEQRAQKIAHLRAMLEGPKHEATLKASGMGKEELSNFLGSLEREHSASVGKAPVAAKAKAPQGPPPRWLMEQKEKEKRTGGGVPQPTTPTEEMSGNLEGRPEPMHRERNPARSAMRPAWKHRPASYERRIGYATQNLRTELPIFSYRSCGDQLWFFMPGATVSCDNCQKSVPQSMGSLQGAPGHSQFAQNMFVCSDCMGVSLGM